VLQADQPAVEPLEEQNEIGVVNRVGGRDQIRSVHAIAVVLVEFGGGLDQEVMKALLENHRALLSGWLSPEIRHPRSLPTAARGFRRRCCFHHRGLCGGEGAGFASCGRI
jgi:hypothetical protein